MTDLIPQLDPAQLRRQAARRLIVGDESDERACAPIPESAASDDPRAARLLLAQGGVAGLADRLAGAGLVLPWLLAGIGAPATFIGLLLPVRQAGALLARLAAGPHIRALGRRKWVWVAAGLFQALTLTVIGAGAMILPPELAGPLAVLALAVAGMAAGAGALALQDVLAKTVPGAGRGRLVFQRSQIASGLTVLAAVLLWLLVGDDASAQVNVPLVLLAALLWVGAAGAMALLAEAEGEREGGRDLLGGLREGLLLPRRLPVFRRFLEARCLLLGVELAMPFFALHASEAFGNGATLLGAYLLAMGLAQGIAGPLWRHWATAPSQRLMAAAGSLGAAAGAAALVLAWVPAPAGGWAYMLVFGAAALAEGGLRLGQHGYLLEGTPEPERPRYLACANSVAAGLGLAAVLVGLLADLSLPFAAVALMTALAAAGAWRSWRLPDARDLLAETADMALTR